ncbi:DUF1295 domain-containing protein [Erythrobacter alti]|uniref:DUF1295 domain-containing protein n=1 Tax=Erythrobacter alti TaxID=1896145 RepID=UPI0030F431FB
MIDGLLANFAMLLVAMLLLWLVSLGLREVSFVDAVWGFAMAGLALASIIAHLRTAKPSDVAIILFLMTFVWGLRLGIYLLRRYMNSGEDKRYRNILPPPDEFRQFAMTSLWKVWLLQAVLIMLVSSPMQVGVLAATSEQSLSIWALPGLALYAIGLIFEWVGDRQLARFKADPQNRGKVMDRGLWRYTRHPNYFGDACVWWGIWLVAMTVDPAAVAWTVAGPIFLTFTLVRWSGAAMTEIGMRDKYGEEFASYVRRTSAFIPMPPKRARKSHQT